MIWVYMNMVRSINFTSGAIAGIGLEHWSVEYCVTLVQVIMRINIRRRQWKIDFISMPWHMQFRGSVVGTL